MVGGLLLGIYFLNSNRLINNRTYTLPEKHKKVKRKNKKIKIHYNISINMNENELKGS